MGKTRENCQLRLGLLDSPNDIEEINRFPPGGGATTTYAGAGCAMFWGAFFQAENNFWGIIFGYITMN